jgi:hypothetical protein
MGVNEENIDGRLHGEQPDPGPKDTMPMRLLFMILIAIMLSFASTVLGVLTFLQFLLMMLNQGKPNERLADFGTDLGIWIAKAARYQTAASEVKPWPWTELD